MTEKQTLHELFGVMLHVRHSTAPDMPISIECVQSVDGLYKPVGADLTDLLDSLVFMQPQNQGSVIAYEAIPVLSIIAQEIHDANEQRAS